MGQFVVGVVGETREDALKGAKHVHIDYEPLTPVLSIEVSSNGLFKQILETVLDTIMTMITLNF